MGGKIAFIIIAVLPLVAWGKDYFRAAVFEHRSRTEGQPTNRDVISKNLEYYEIAAKLAAKKGVDILLFNEFGILHARHRRDHHRSYAEPIPDPQKGTYNPCSEGGTDHPILSTFSCLARRNNIYLVAHQVDLKPCEGTCDAEVKECDQKCPADGVYMYNAAVVFDRKGNLIVRYYKTQTFTEALNAPEDPTEAIFETEFGRFGLFTCFDSVWSSSKNLARNHDLDAAVFPTFWFDDIVPLNSVEWQQSWAIANNVNLLAANTHSPGNGSLGSGIYSKDLGALVYTYEPDGESKLLISNVPTIPLDEESNFSPEASVIVVQKDKTYLKEETGDLFPENSLASVAGPFKDQYKDYRVYTSLVENYTLTKLEKAEDSIESCQDGFCCKLEYSVDSDDGAVAEEYYLGAFSGFDNARGYFRWCEETCVLLRCNPAGESKCAMQPPTATTVFKHLRMSADFASEVVYPAISLNKFRLAPKYEWDFDHEGSAAVLEYEAGSEEPLLKAALMGRCYDKDPPYVPFFPKMFPGY